MNDCTVELKCFGHSLLKMSLVHYLDEQDITIRHNEDDDDTTSSTDEYKIYGNKTDAKKINH